MTKRKTASTTESFGVVKQVQIAFNRRNRLATALGFLMGGFVPSATYTVAHFEVATRPLMWLMVVGGLLFSAVTVYKWASLALNSNIKAVGFVILLEGVMTFAATPWLSFAGLFMLACVNGIATGSNLVNRERVSRREANAPSLSIA